jgi:D-alanyl-D-alanine carboxypeptidase/D-alanyl-D-alanine-endopeptidase (penicillin-binding protein 4)
MTKTAAAIFGIVFLAPLTPAHAQTAQRAAGSQSAQTDQSAQTSQSALAAKIAAIVDAGDYARATWGIDVRDLQTGAVVYSRNANDLFVPASNMKLIVSAAASHYLEPDFRYRTGLYGTGEVSDGVLRGDLIVRGRGDPTISARYYPERTTVLENIADSLRVRGITRIAGRIIADQTYFDDELVRGDWELYDLNWWYAAPVAPLGFNDNAIDFRVAAGSIGTPADITWEPNTADFVFVNRTRTVARGARYTLDFDRIAGSDTVFAYGEIPADATVRTESFTTRNPGRYLGTVLRETLERKGIAVGEDDVRVVTPPDTSPTADATLLFEYASPPLQKIIDPILLNSQNWFAEMLLKTMAREVSGAGSWSAGLDLERRFLVDNVGIDSTAFRLRDASGLSSANLITPRLLTELVRYIARTPRMKPAYDAMSVSGSPGSLRRRFEDMPGRVRAKTGSIGNVDSLSGILEGNNGRMYVFSIVANNTGQPSARTRELIDRVVRAVAQTK